MSYGLRLDESKATENPYALHFEGSAKEANLPGPGSVLRRLSYPIHSWDIAVPLLRGSWRFMSQELATEEVASFPAEAPPQNPVNLPESPDPMNWTDVLAWTLSATGIGLGIYLVKDAYGTDKANQHGLGIGLTTAGSTWAVSEILNRIVYDRRPDRRGALLGLSLGSGTVLGMAAKLTMPPPLLPRSAFQDQSRSVNAKNPVSEWGP